MKKEKLNHIEKPNTDKSALLKAKKMEKLKLKKGYKWMQKGKTKIYAHPDRIEKYIEEGYK